MFVKMGTHGQVDRVLDSRSEGLGFNSQHWSRIEVSGKLHIPQCLDPFSRNGYLVHRSEVGSIVAGCCRAHLVNGKVKLLNMCSRGCLDYKQLHLPLPLCVYSGNVPLSMAYNHRPSIGITLDTCECYWNI